MYLTLNKHICKPLYILLTIALAITMLILEDIGIQHYQTESHISSLHCGSKLPNDLLTQQSGCGLMGFDYNLAGTRGCVQWFLLCLFWRWLSECRKIPFIFKILPKGGRKVVWQTDVTARHSKDNRETICDFCMISICSVPIFL